MCPGRAAKTTEKNPTSSALKPAFDVLDVDRDGKISSEDLREFYSSLSGTQITDEDMIGSMMSAADSDKNGFVEYEEFARVLNRRKESDKRRGYQYEVVEDAFKLIDGDGDGKVGCDDLKRWLTAVGMEVDDDEILAMVRLAGGEDGDNGGVTCEGFRRILGIDD